MEGYRKIAFNLTTSAMFEMLDNTALLVAKDSNGYSIVYDKKEKEYIGRDSDGGRMFLHIKPHQVWYIYEPIKQVSFSEAAKRYFDGKVIISNIDKKYKDFFRDFDYLKDGNNYNCLRVATDAEIDGLWTIED